MALNPNTSSPEIAVHSTPVAHTAANSTPGAHSAANSTSVTHTAAISTPDAHSAANSTQVTHTAVNSTSVAQTAVNATPVAHTAEAGSTPDAHSTASSTPVARTVLDSIPAPITANDSTLNKRAVLDPATAALTTAGGDHAYPYGLMTEQRHALEHLHADFRWGPFGIRVIRFHLTTFPAGKIDRFHKHSEEYELHFVPRGKGMVILEDMPYALGEGMMYLTAPGVMHYQEAHPKEAMDELCLRIQIVRLEEGAPAKSWGAEAEWNEAETCVRQLGLIPLRPAMDRFRAMECFLTAYRAWYESQPGLLTVIRQSIVNILLRMTRAYFPEPQQQLPSRDINRYRCRLAEQFIKDNYQEPLTLEAVAERIHISPRQLQRILKSQTGSTFSDYVESVRLSHVCRELEQSSKTIEQLAVRNGFSSANYLHRVFKRKLGVTPMQYRSVHAAEPD